MIVIRTKYTASKAPQRIFDKCVCVSACTHKTPNLTILFSQTTPDEHPPTPPPRRWSALISLPTFAKFQLVWCHLCDVMLLFRCSCLFEHTLAVVRALPEYQSCKNNLYINLLWTSKCLLYFRPDLYRFEVRLELYAANARLIVSPPSLPPSHPPTPLPSRWSTLSTLPPLAKFQLVWCRLCESLLSSFAGQKYSSLVTRLILGRRWVNLLPAAQRSNAFNNWRPLRITLRFLV